MTSSLSVFSSVQCVGEMGYREFLQVLVKTSICCSLAVPIHATSQSFYRIVTIIVLLLQMRTLGLRDPKWQCQDLQHQLQFSFSSPDTSNLQGCGSTVAAKLDPSDPGTLACDRVMDTYLLPGLRQTQGHRVPSEDCKQDKAVKFRTIPSRWTSGHCEINTQRL